MPARLLLLGSPMVESGRDSIALPLERRSQLLAFLALRRSWVGRAEIAAMLWPEQGAKLAYSNLRKTLFRLQSVAWAGGIAGIHYRTATEAGIEMGNRIGAMAAARHLRPQYSTLTRD